MAFVREMPLFPESGGWTEWRVWRDELCCLLEIKKAMTPEDKLNFLKYCGGARIRQLLTKLPPNNPPGTGLYVSIREPDPLDDAIDKLNDYFRPQRDTILAIKEFNLMVQEKEETVKDFVIRLK